jgi:TRAP-type C4-dicarboxylate transport system permease small subunit
VTPGEAAAGGAGARPRRARWALDHLEELVGGAAFAAMTAVVFANVCARYVLNDPIPGADELATLGFTWAVFLGASAGVRQRLHLGIELVARLVRPPRARAALALLVAALMGGFAVLVGVYGVKLMATAQFKRTPVLQWPYTWVYLAVPVGAALMLLRLLPIARQHWRELAGRAGAPRRPLAPERIAP